MGRIKQGLDYFPMSTSFMHDRVVRRVMKREGDAAFATLVETLSYIYAGKGYYISAGDEFYDELTDSLYNTDMDDVKRIIALSVECGLFDAGLFRQYGILTSADIQRQYLFITKRRSRHHICPDYCLLPEGEKAESTEPVKSAEEMPEKKTTDEQPDTVAATGENVAVSPDIATASRDTATKTALIKRKEKEKKENILPNPPFAKGGDEEEGSEGEKVAEGAGGGMREECDQRSAKKKRNLTQEDIDRMQAPPDGCPRNFSGLLENLRLFRVPPAEQYAIVLKSNYGEIGGDIWKGFSVIRGSGGKIKLPGHYLLSVLNK